jgi:hypothetical protein
MVYNFYDFDDKHRDESLNIDVRKFDIDVNITAVEILGYEDSEALEVSSASAKLGEFEPFSIIQDGSEDDTDDDFEIL